MKTYLKLASSIALVAASPWLALAADPPTTDLSLWLKADSGVTLNGGKVAHWADQSGLGHDAFQNADASQPALVTSATGASAVRFDGMDDFLGFTNDINGLPGVTIFLVANNTAPSQNGGTSYSDNPAIFWNESASWGWVFLSPFQTNVNWRFGTTVSSNNERYARPTSVGANYTLTTLVKDTSTESLYVNKTLAQSVTGKGVITFGVREDAWLGRGQSTYFQGEIMEVLVYNVALSTADQQAVEDYLYAKYLSNPQPTVQVTGPDSGTSFTAPANITITADALDDGLVTNVEFFADGISIGSAANEPFSITWNNAPGGGHVLTAKATDNQGAWSISAKKVIQVNYATATEGPRLTSLGLWYEADRGVTNVGGKVARWADQSGYERDAVQPLTSAQPVLVMGGNGKPSVSFDGITNFMNFSMPMAGLTGLTMVVVANNTAPQNTGDGGEGAAIMYWSEPPTPGWGGMNIGVFQNSATWRFGTGQAQNSTINYPGPAVTRPASLQRNYSRTVVVKTGTTESMYTNGVLAVTASGKLATTAYINENGANLARGNQGGQYTYFRGEIQEILIYTEPLSSDDLADLEAYLTTKYWGRVQPTVNITSPADNTGLVAPSSITIAANPIDDGTITNLNFFDSGTLIGTVTSAPWEFTLSSPPQGPHTFTAVATDNEGLFNYSQPVMVFVRPASGFALVENFENRALAPLEFQGDWTGVFQNDKVVMDTTTFQGGKTNNKVLLQVKNNQTLAFPVLVPQGNTGTLFFRAASTTWSREQLYLGFSDQRSFGRAGIGDFAAQMTRDTGANLANKMIGVRDGGAYYNSITNFASDTWYKIWIVANNLSDTFKVYIQGGEYADPTPLLRNGNSSFAFRNAAASRDLIRFLIWTSATTWSTGGFWIDDIYLAEGENITDPTLPGLPILKVVKSGTDFIVSWPTAAGEGYSLEATSSLAAPSWSAVSEQQVQVGDETTVTLTANEGTKFLRLRK